MKPIPGRGKHQNNSASQHIGLFLPFNVQFESYDIYLLVAAYKQTLHCSLRIKYHFQRTEASYKPNKMHALYFQRF